MTKSVRHTVCCSLILLGLLACSANAGDALWTTNYAQAQKEAAKTGKSLLMDFSGSDWCGWCIRLDNEVFAHDVFKQAVTKDFVPVLLDYPRNKSKIPAEVQAQNERLQAKYDIKVYPTVILADAQGRPYAQTGYQAGGPEAYLKHLAELRQKGTKLAENLKLAESPDLKPLEKVGLLDKAVDGMDMSVLVAFYADVLDEIISLDKDNKAGIRKKYEMRMRVAQAEKALAESNAAKAIELYQAIIRDFKPQGEQAQSLYFSLSEAHFGARQMDKAKANLAKALQAAPESKNASMIKAIMKRHFSESAEQ